MTKTIRALVIGAALAGFATGNDFSRIACTRVKIAVLAPMPREMVRMTVMAKPGAF